MQSIGTAHAKLLLFGEHAAVYGLPAVGLPLPSAISVTLSPSTLDYGWQYQTTHKDFIPALHQLIGEIGNIVPEFTQIKGGTLSITSDIIPGIGCGSSAALCVAFVKAVCGLFPHLNPELNQIWDWANRCERIFHGNPSGIDTGLSCFNRLCAFTSSGSGLPSVQIISNIRLFLLIGIFKRRLKTGQLVAYVKNKVDQDNGCEEEIRALGAIARNAIQHLEKNDSELYKTLGALATKAQSGLAKLGLSTPAQDYFFDIAEKTGALGGKISGAGGGGSVFLIAQNQRHLLELRNRFKHLSDDSAFDERPIIQALVWENERAAFVT